MREYSTSVPQKRKTRYAIIDRGYDTPCWEWLMATTDKGYAQINIDGRTRRAHRVYYEDKHGAVPEGMVLDHLCRNRKCVNPDHMEAVSNTENIRRGHGTRLTEFEVDAIRTLEGIASGADVGRRFGLTRQHVYRIWSGERWEDSAIDVVANVNFLRKIDFKSGKPRIVSRINGNDGP